jgi:hypothetical protein
MRKRRLVSWGKLSTISAFPQELVVRVVASATPTPKARRSRIPWATQRKDRPKAARRGYRGVWRRNIAQLWSGLRRHAYLTTGTVNTAPDSQHVLGEGLGAAGICFSQHWARGPWIPGATYVQALQLLLLMQAYLQVAENVLASTGIGDGGMSLPYRFMYTLVSPTTPLSQHPAGSATFGVGMEFFSQHFGLAP